MTLLTVHFWVQRNFHSTFDSQEEEGEEAEGECCFFKREGERVNVREREREKGRDLFALQKPGRELSWSAAAWLAHTGL